MIISVYRVRTGSSPAVPHHHHHLTIHRYGDRAHHADLAGWFTFTLRWHGLLPVQSSVHSAFRLIGYTLSLFFSPSIHSFGFSVCPTRNLWVLPITYIPHIYHCASQAVCHASNNKVSTGLYKSAAGPVFVSRCNDPDEYKVPSHKYLLARPGQWSV